jgi:inhibitor of cysteine peptidase
MARKVLAFLAVAGMIGLSLPARAALCPACRDRMLVDSPGKCESCGAATASGALRLCPKCSAKQNRCELCGKSLDGWHSPGDSQPAATDTSRDKPAGDRPPREAGPAPEPGGTADTAIPVGKPPEGKPAPETPAPPPAIDVRRPGTYAFGKWQYRLDVTTPGNGTEGRWGTLWYDGQKLPHGGVNDYYRTPWGPLYWVDVPGTPWGQHGWMPAPLGQSNRQGRPLALPASLVAGQSRSPATPSPTTPPSPSPSAAPKPAATSNRQTLEVTKGDSGKRARLYVGNVLIVRLPGSPTTGYQWQVAPTGISAVRLAARPQYIASPAPAGVMGGSGTFVFTFQAVQPGTGSIRLIYARPGERERTAADTFGLAIEVLPVAAANQQAAGSGWRGN